MCSLVARGVHVRCSCHPSRWRGGPAVQHRPGASVGVGGGRPNMEPHRAGAHAPDRPRWRDTVAPRVVAARWAVCSPGNRAGNRSGQGFLLERPSAGQLKLKIIPQGSQCAEIPCDAPTPLRGTAAAQALLWPAAGRLLALPLDLVACEHVPPAVPCGRVCHCTALLRQRALVPRIARAHSCSRDTHGTHSHGLRPTERGRDAPR